MATDESEAGRRAKPGTRACGLVALVLAWAAATGVVYLVLHTHMLMRPRPVSLAEITYITGVSFPDSARLVDSSFRDLPRAWLAAKLYIDRADLEPFRASEQFSIEWTKGEAHYAPHYADQWEPPAAGHGVWSTCVKPPRRRSTGVGQPVVQAYVEVAVRDADSAVVYVFGAGS